MTRFKEALLDQLLDQQRQLRAAEPVRASRAPRRAPALVAAGAGTLVVAAITGWAALPARTPHPDRPVPAAYTVTRGDDGIVTFTVRRLVDSAAATRDLRAAGINATVLNASTPEDCPTSLESLAQSADARSITYQLPANGDTIRLSRRLLGDGRLLIVVDTSGQVNQSGQSVALESIPLAGPAPDCVSVTSAPAPTPTDTQIGPAPGPTTTR